MAKLIASLQSPEAGDGFDVEDVPSSGDLTPSFNGRLNMSEFAYSPKASDRAKTSNSSPTGLRQSKLLGNGEGQVVVSATRRSKRKSPNSATSSQSKKARSSSSYAPPSKYAHLPNLPDSLTPNLICVFVGLNPGIQTATTGHAYAHPSNLFWKLLYSSGCTNRRCLPSETHDLPRLFALGNTNIVERPTRNGAELKQKEMDDGVEALNTKFRQNKPEAVCIVGKSIWESIWRVKHGRAIKKEEFKYGWQDERENMGRGKDEEGKDWKGAKVFVATSTSGLAASLSPAEKETIWRELGVWVEQRRMERSSSKAKTDGIVNK